MMNGYAMSGWGWLLMTLGMLGFGRWSPWLPLPCCDPPASPTISRSRTSRHGPVPRSSWPWRLARGEIDPEEYRQRLQTLQEATNRT